MRGRGDYPGRANGGGIFSPSLMVGALSGLAFGHIATSILPDISGSETLYALAGTGAVAAAVLGAPISTIMIVFELTGDWQTGIAVMTAVSLSTALSSRLVDRSFFLTQLENRGIRVAAGPQAYLLAMFPVSMIMRDLLHPDAAQPEECQVLIAQGLCLDCGATLEQALPLFERTNAVFLPVIGMGAKGEPPVLVGTLFHVDVLSSYARALAATAAEEHS